MIDGVVYDPQDEGGIAHDDPVRGHAWLKAPVVK